MAKLFEIWLDTAAQTGAIRTTLPWNLQLPDGKVGHFKTEQAAQVYRDAVIKHRQAAGKK